MRIKRAKWEPERALEAADTGSGQGLQKASRVILELANQHAPLDTGRLIGSAAVDFDASSPKTASVYYDTPYAAKLHQDRRLKIKGGREGQWLKKALMKGKSTVLQFISDELKLRFRR